MAQLATSDGPWKERFAWLPMKIDRRWIWLEHYQQRKVSVMILGRGICFNVIERQFDPKIIVSRWRARGQ